MKAHVVNVDLDSRRDCFFLRGFGCTHIGSASCDEDRLDKDIKSVKKRKNCFAFLGGDMGDFVNISDKRFDIKSVSKGNKDKLDNLAQKQCDSVVDKFMPIKDRLWFYITGNHEEKIRNRYYFDAAGYIASRLDIPMLGYSALVRITINRQKGTVKKPSNKVVILFVHHGFGGGRKVGGKINNAIDKSSHFDADIYWFFHVHDEADVKAPIIRITRGGIPRLIESKRLFIIGGTYLKTYQENTTSYGEKAGYPPTNLGSTVVKFVPFSVTTVDANKQMELPVRYKVVELEDV